MGFELYISEGGGVRKLIAVLDYIMRKLIFYDIIPIIYQEWNLNHPLFTPTPFLDPFHH